jgi:L-fuconolactonase
MIDAHFHIWQLDRGDYGWLTPALRPIYRDVTVEDWKQQSRPCGVAHGIIVQAAPTESETFYILEQAARHPDRVLGVVGWVNMLASDAPSRVRQLAGNLLLKGLRPMLQDIADPDWILRPELDPVLRTISEAQLTFDALVKPVHLPRILTLAERFPELRIVIDHSAKPDIASGAFYTWAKELEQIASRSTAYCKLSGLMTEAGPNPDSERIERYVKHVLNVFGPDRVLWGSDWPVLELAATYETWHKIARGLVPSAEHDQVFDATARSAYRLG